MRGQKNVLLAIYCVGTGGWGAGQIIYIYTQAHIHQFALGSKRPQARVGFMEGDDK